MRKLGCNVACDAPPPREAWYADQRHKDWLATALSAKIKQDAAGATIVSTLLSKTNQELLTPQAYGKLPTAAN